MKRTMIVLGIVVLAAGAAPDLMAERPIPAEKAAAMANETPRDVNAPVVRTLDEPMQTSRPTSARAMGTIIYDDGLVTAAPTTTSFSYGNQFDTFTGNPVMTSGSVHSASFYMQTVAGTDAFLSVYGPVSGTAAPFYGSFLVSAVTGWNTHQFATPVAYTGSSFLLGIWYFSDVPGLGSGTVDGQGHHGMMINDIVGTGFQPLSGLNALLAASGEILPVELMSFSIE